MRDHPQRETCSLVAVTVTAVADGRHHRDSQVAAEKGHRWPDFDMPAIAVQGRAYNSPSERLKGDPPCTAFRNSRSIISTANTSCMSLPIAGKNYSCTWLVRASKLGWSESMDTR